MNENEVARDAPPPENEAPPANEEGLDIALLLLQQFEKALGKRPPTSKKPASESRWTNSTFLGATCCSKLVSRICRTMCD